MRNYIDLITEEKQNQQLIENFQYAGKMIAEAQLTADQINQIFAGIEKNLSAAGGNRTAIGKGVDTAKSAAGAVGKAYNDLIDKFSNTKVMQGFDAAYDKAAEQLKQATGGDQGAMQYIQKYRDFAKKHPVAQSAIYALLIAAVSIGSGGAAAPAALGLLKMGDRLVQGDKFSQALAKGATTGAMAAVGQGIKGAISGHDAVPQQKVFRGASGYTNDDMDQAVKYAKMATDPTPDAEPTTAARSVPRPKASGIAAIDNARAQNFAQQDMMNDFAKKMGLTGDNHRAIFKGGVPVEIDGKPVPSNLYTPDQAQNVAAAKKMATQMANPTGAGDSYPDQDNPYNGMAKKALKQKYTGPISSADNFESRVLEAATYNFQWIALPQNLMIDYSKSWQPDYLGESQEITGTTLTYEGVQCVFNNLERLHDHLLEAESEYGPEIKKPGIFGRLGAGIKQAAGAVAGSKFGQAVGKGVQAVKTAAGNVTTSVTADKLNKAWQTAGSPMDSKALLNFLTQQGVDKSVVAATYKSLNIPLQTGGRVAGQGLSQTANAIRKRNARAAAKQQQPASQPGAQMVQPMTAQAKPMPRPATPQPTSTSGTAKANFGAVGAQTMAPPKAKRIKKAAEGVSKRLEV